MADRVLTMLEIVLQTEDGAPSRWRIGEHDVVVYYDTQQAVGDNGQPTDDLTGEYEAWVDDRCVKRQHVSPYGGRYGNPHAQRYAAEQVARALERAVFPRGVLR